MMLCDRCHNEEACIHIRGMDPEGNLHSLNLCASCAFHEFSSENGSSDEKTGAFQLPSLPGPLDLFKILSELSRRVSSSRRINRIDDLLMNAENISLQLLKDLGKESENSDSKAENEEGSLEVCPGCGRKKKEFRQSFLLGCPACLSAFRKDISAFLNLGDNFSFEESDGVVKGNREFESNENGQLAFRRLHARMQAAVKAEEYELAAQLKQELANQQLVLAQRRSEEPVSCWGKIPVTDEFATADYLLPNLPWLPKRKTGRPLIRLASVLYWSRNLASCCLPPFTGHPEHGEEVCNLLSPFLEHEPVFGAVKVYDPRSMEKKERLELTERGWCPHEFVFRSHACRVFVSENERVVALVNNFDHLGLTLWGGEDDFPPMLKQIHSFAENLARQFRVEKDARFGYFSCHLRSLGTGMGLAQLLHLPGLNFSGQIDQVMQACAELKFQLRPLFKWNENTCGAFYILQSPHGFFVPGQQIEALQELSRTVARREVQCREKMQSDNDWRLRLSDAVGRAAGKLKGMYLLDFPEAQHLLSLFWLGCELQMLPWLSMEQILQKITEILTMPAQLEGNPNLRKDQMRIRRQLARSFRKDLLHLDEPE